jgi:two-component system nitrogen regulation response regulator GlnG
VGKLVDADGGTLFLDEIGDMPLDAQTRLLRVIDGSEPAVNPKTGRRPNVRIIAATNRDLRGLIQQGLFREDLFFRLNVAPIRIPPLRDRAEDIPDLARAFLLRAAREGLPAKTIDSSRAGPPQAATIGQAMSASWRTSSAASAPSTPRT